MFGKKKSFQRKFPKFLWKQWILRIQQSYLRKTFFMGEREEEDILGKVSDLAAYQLG